ncbi:MAG: hypothetical protein IPP37_10920 [Saprospiraceae bacterium]|nr:hypothetical protein [Saprospiraceae bacterium]
MVNLYTFIIIITYNIMSLVAQSNSDEQAIIQVLGGKKVEHGYKWNFKDTAFKKLALSKLNDPSIPKQKKVLNLFVVELRLKLMIQSMTGNF